MDQLVNYKPIYLPTNGASSVVLVVENPAANAGDRDTGLIPGSRRSPGEGNRNPLQYSCLENPMDRGAWQAIVHRVTKSWTQLNQPNMHTCTLELWEDCSRETMTTLIKVKCATYHHCHGFDLPDLYKLLQKAGLSPITPLLLLVPFCHLLKMKQHPSSSLSNFLP